MYNLGDSVRAAFQLLGVMLQSGDSVALLAGNAPWYISVVTALQIPILYLGSDYAGSAIASAQEVYNAEEIRMMSEINDTMGMSLVIRVNQLYDHMMAKFVRLGYACLAAIHRGKTAKGKHQAFVSLLLLLCHCSNFVASHGPESPGTPPRPGQHRGVRIAGPLRA